MRMNHGKESSTSSQNTSQIASCKILGHQNPGGSMSKSRREFLTITSLGALGVAATCRLEAQNPAELPPGAPSAFGAGPAVGPEVSATTFAEAEQVVEFPLAGAERSMAAASWRRTLAAVYERRTGPKKMSLEGTVSPATRW